MTIKIEYDSGYRGQIVSLAGVKGRLGLGLKLQMDAVAVDNVTRVQVLQSNPQRVFAIMTNEGDVDVLFALTGDTGYALHRVAARGGVFQIDKDLPWTGGVWFYGAYGATTVSYTEGLVQ